MQTPTHPTERGRDWGAVLVVTISPATSSPCGTEFVTMGALVQDEGTSCSHRAVLQWDKELCQNQIRDHWSRAGNKSQVQTKSCLEAAHPQVPKCPSLLLGATGAPQGALLPWPQCHMPPASSAEVL